MRQINEIESYSAQFPRSRATGLKAVSDLGGAPGSSAFVVDFGSVQNFDDPTVARAMLEHFERATSEATAAIGRLAQHQVGCLCSTERAPQLVAAVEELNALVSEQNLGSLRADRYVLPRDSRALAHRIRTIVGAVDPTRAARLHRDRRDDLGLLLRMEQMLRQADISSLVHHQSIYDFSRPRNPVPLASELTVSIERLAERLGIALDQKPWLFDKATLLLDRRMLFHLVQDRGRHDEPFAINLRVATVLEPGFPDLVGRLAARDHETLIVELSDADRAADPQAFAAAVRELDRLGIHIAFHAGGWDSLRVLIEADGERLGSFLRYLDFLKVRWDPADEELTAAQTEALAELVRKAGPGRVVLERAETEAAIEFALRIGIHLLQGFGVSDRVQAQRTRERDREAARTRRAAHKADEPEGEAPKPGMLSKMFRL